VITATDEVLMVRTKRQSVPTSGQSEENMEIMIQGTNATSYILVVDVVSHD
jgi:hypothetical protein